MTTYDGSIRILDDFKGRFSSTKYEFTKDDANQLMRVSECLEKLEWQRRCAGQLFETETIKVCVAQNRLSEFRNEKLRELVESRRKVQELNREELKTENEELKILKDDVALLLDISKRFAADLQALRTQEMRLTRENEETISALNRGLRNKAASQIELNNTHEAAQNTRIKADGLMKKMETINKELNAQRKQTKRSIVQLEIETANLKEKLDAQNARNEVLRGPYEEAEVTLAEINQKNRLLTNGHEEQKIKITELRKAIARLKDTLASQITENARLSKSKKEVDERLSGMIATHNTILASLEAETKDLKQKKEEATMNTENLRIRQDNLKKDLEEAETQTDKKKSLIVNMLKQTKKVEEDLLNRLAEMGQLEDEIERMEKDAALVKSSSKNLITTYQAQLASMRNQLSAEQKERVESQRKKRQLAREVVDFKAEYNRTLRNAQRQINRAKSKKAELIKEQGILRQNTQYNLQQARELRQYIFDLCKRSEEERREHNENIKESQKNLQRIMDRATETEANILLETPGNEAVLANVKTMSEFYAQLKQAQVDLTHEIRTLNQEALKMNTENERLAKTVEEMIQQQEDVRKDLIDRLEQSITEIRKKEYQIYVAGCRIKTTKIENSRLERAMDHQEDDMRKICNDWEKIMRNKAKVRYRIYQLQQNLMESRDKEVKESRESAGAYEQASGVLQSVFADSQLRREAISHFLEGLFYYIQKVDGYLGNKCDITVR
ncbi:unnamed protein product [Calicophoron daubneyi]|uniref:Coiled-coil domain-containing protein 39 n=1 Tax=Calicophoron daubneyi TaxID=300641 RepID=A0AAV2TT05_CALDB